jgi:hypothetical protein
MSATSDDRQWKKRVQDVRREIFCLPNEKDPLSTTLKPIVVVLDEADAD